MSTRQFLRLTHALHTAVVLGIMPLIGLLCAAYIGIAYSATTTVTVGVGDTKLIANGKTAPNSFVTILDGNAVIGTTVADAAGAFTKTFTAFSPGIHNLQIYSKDSQDYLTDTTRVQVNINEHTATTVTSFLAPTFVSDPASVDQGTPLIFSGNSYPGATITFLYDEAYSAQTTAAIDGRWSYTLDSSGLAIGTHQAFVAATDGSSGDQSYSTRKLAFSVTSNTQPVQPSRPTSPTTSPPSTPTVIQPVNNNVVTDSQTTVRGTAAPNSQVNLYNNGRLIGSTITDATGNWSITFNLDGIEYNLRAESCTATTCGQLSDAISFVYQPPNGAQQFAVKTPDLTEVVPRGTNTFINLQILEGTPPFTVTVRWGDGRLETFVQPDRNLSLTHAYTRAGNFAGDVTITDADNKTVTLMFSRLVVKHSPLDKPTYQWIIVLIPFAVLMLLGIGRYGYWRINHRRIQLKAHKHTKKR